MIDVNEYQDKTKNTAFYPGAGEGKLGELMYLALGLTGEGGEVANRVKKMFRDSGTYDLHRMVIFDELGDVMWYTAMLCNALGFDLNEILLNNLEKLDDRKKRGTLGGSGDKR